MAIPATYHRRYFRERTNFRLTNPVSSYRNDHPCDENSRWRKFAFSNKEGDDGVWDVQIIKMNPQPSIISVHWYLIDIQGLTKDENMVTEIYGFKQGEGQSIIFFDSDYNAKVSPGDIFRFYPGEGATLADEPSLNDYSFRLKFDPTGDTIGSDVAFTS